MQRSRSTQGILHSSRPRRWPGPAGCPVVQRGSLQGAADARKRTCAIRAGARGPEGGFSEPPVRGNACQPRCGAAETCRRPCRAERARWHKLQTHTRSRWFLGGSARHAGCRPQLLSGPQGACGMRQCAGGNRL
eukprot:2029523-Alexandrium_andersonii.AAC.1